MMVKRHFIFLKTNQGSAAIEFAIVLPFLFLFLSGVINFGLILGNQNEVNAIVSAGILYANGNSSTPATVQAIMQTTTNLSPLTATATKVCECYPTSGAPSGTPSAAACTATCSGSLGSYVTVTASSQVNLFALDFVLANPFPTSASATIRTN